MIGDREERAGVWRNAPEYHPADEPVPFEELGAYRGIAAILILVFHVYQFSREGLGLDRYVYEGTALHVLFNNLRLTEWFFVLTGFLLFFPIARAALTRDRLRSIYGFPLRWAFQVLPLYYVAVLVVWTWRYFGSAEQIEDLIQHLTFTYLFSREHIFWTIGPSWTVGLEVIFLLSVVLLGPLFYWGCGFLRTPVARAAALAGVAVFLVVFSAGYKWWAFYLARIPGDDYPVYFGPLANLDTFAFGMLVAVAAVSGRVVLRGSTPALLAAGGVALAVLLAVVGQERDFAALYSHTFSGAAFALVLAATVLGPRDSAFRRALGRPNAVFLGTISYGIFLWHEPILIELGKRDFLIDQAPEAFPQNVIVLVALSIAAATLSYYAIERPALFLRYLFDRGGRRRSRLSPRHPG